MQVEFHQQIERIPGADWNRLFGTDHPFTRHEFLAALETSGSATPQTGWQPAHVTLRDDSGRLLAALPLYLKSHSMGEYVFDWSWADFWQRQGRPYYPKLLTAVPFTPCTGPRFAVAQEAAGIRDRLFGTVAEAVRQFAAARRFSSWHILFPAEGAALLEPGPFLRRDGWRYQWSNPGYADFPAFLAELSAKKRKNIRHEIRDVQAAGIHFEVLEAEAIRPEHWRHFYRLYHGTYLRHGQVGYLEEDFFLALSETMPEHLVMVRALRDSRCIAASLFLRSAECLYGRYWGCTEPVPGLHFVTCYYEGIQYCIQRGLRVFDPGVQGEHKIARGFLPVLTHSWHWLADPELAQAVRIFLHQESEAVDGVTRRLAGHSPFRKDLGPRGD